MLPYSVADIVGTINPWNKGQEDGKTFAAAQLIDVYRSAKTGELAPSQPVTIANVDEGLGCLGISVRTNILLRRIEVSFEQKVEDMLGQNGWGLDKVDLRMSVAIDVLRRARMPNVGMLRDMITSMASATPFHPGEKWLSDVSHYAPWDGKSDPIGDLLATVTLADEVEDRAVFDAAMRVFFLQVVQATIGWRTPKSVPYVPIFIGGQGLGKTQWVKELLPNGYARENISLTGGFGHIDKDTLISATNFMIGELGEAAVLRKNDVNALKGFLSNTVDRIRLPYARGVTEFPRVSCYIGTSNETALFSDGSGNRRFWPFEVTAMDFKALFKLRNAAWSQALALRHNGADWWPDQALAQALEQRAEGHRTKSAMEERLEASLSEFIGTDWQMARKGGLKDDTFACTAFDVADWLMKARATPQDIVVAKNWLDRNGFRAKGQQRVNGVQKNAAYILPVATHWGKDMTDLPTPLQMAIVGLSIIP